MAESIRENLAESRPGSANTGPADIPETDPIETPRPPASGRLLVPQVIAATSGTVIDVHGALCFSLLLHPTQGFHGSAPVEVAHLDAGHCLASIAAESNALAIARAWLGFRLAPIK